MANGIVDANERFLRDAAGRHWERTLVVSFPDDPKIDRPGKWEPESVAARKARRAWPLNPEWNNYFCVSQFKGDAVRRESLFDGMFVLAVDDVGTGQKVDPGQLLHRLGTPTWAWETSPGNQQWIYRLRPRIFDVEKAKALALWVGGDAKGVTRVMRLPVGRNTKEWLGPDGFRVEEVLRSPGAGEIDIEKLWDVVSQDVGTSGAIRRTSVGAAAARSARSVDELLGNDVVGGWLQRFGMVKGLTSNGLGVEIECPWEVDHTVKTDSGTAYFPRTGGFECHHGHCAEKTGRDLRGWLEDHLRSSGLFEGGTAAGQFDKVDDPSDVSPRDLVLRDPYVTEKDQWYSLRDRILIGRKAFNSLWTAPLRGCVGGLRVPAPTKEEPDKTRILRPEVWFFEQRGHQVVSQMAYSPGMEPIFSERGTRYVNTWRPAPRPLLGQGVVTEDMVRPYLDLLDWFVEDENPDAARVIRLLMALKVHRPDVKPGYGMVWGSLAQGAGKDTLIQPLLAGVGEIENVARATVQQLASQFSSYAGKPLMLISDAKRTSYNTATLRDVYENIKQFTENTSKYVGVRGLYKETVMRPNVMMPVVFGNGVDCWPMPIDDRRFHAVFKNVEAEDLPTSRIVATKDWMEQAGGLDLMVEHLHQLGENMSGVEMDLVMGRAPMTPGKQVLIRGGDDRVTACLREVIERLGHDLVTAEEIQELMRPEIRVLGGLTLPSVDRVGILLRGTGARPAHRNQIRVKGHLTRVWDVSPDCRYRDQQPGEIAAAKKAQEEWDKIK